MPPEPEIVGEAFVMLKLLIYRGTPLHVEHIPLLLLLNNHHLPVYLLPQMLVVLPFALNRILYRIQLLLQSLNQLIVLDFYNLLGEDHLLQIGDILLGNDGGVVHTQGLGEFGGLVLCYGLYSGGGVVYHAYLSEGLVEQEGLNVDVLFEDLLQTGQHFYFYFQWNLESQYACQFLLILSLCFVHLFKQFGNLYVYKLFIIINRTVFQIDQLLEYSKNKISHQPVYINTITQNNLFVHQRKSIINLLVKLKKYSPFLSFIIFLSVNLQSFFLNMLNSLYLLVYKQITNYIRLQIFTTFLRVKHVNIILSCEYNMDQQTLNFIYFLAVIGGIWFVIFITKILWNLIKLIIPSKNFTERYGPNTWAVVTGGSDGLGLGFCQQLAQLGFNICMVARNKQKMQQSLQKLEHINQKRQIKTKFIVADFAECQQPNFFNRIMSQLQGLNISILVNNVGISNIGYFHSISDQRIMNQINVNIVSMTMMSHHIIPLMLKRQQRSAIINISSFSAEHPIPYISNYSSSKSYNDIFSRAIQMQYSHKIDILSVRPLYISTNMSKQQTSCTVASRNQCARSALNCLGIDYQTNGVFMHKLIAGVVGCLPQPIVRCMSESSSRAIMEKQNQQMEIRT